MPHCPARRPLDGSPCSLLDGESHPDGLHVTYSDPEARRGILAVWSDPHPFESLPAGPPFRVDLDAARKLLAAYGAEDDEAVTPPERVGALADTLHDALREIAAWRTRED